MHKSILPCRHRKIPNLLFSAHSQLELNAWNKETEAAQSAGQRDDRYFPEKFLLSISIKRKEGRKELQKGGVQAKRRKLCAFS